MTRNDNYTISADTARTQENNNDDDINFSNTAKVAKILKILKIIPLEKRRFVKIIIILQNILIPKKVMIITLKYVLILKTII